MIDSLIDHSVDFHFWHVLYFRRAAIQKRFEVSSHRGPVLRRRNLPRRDGNDADLLVGANRPAQKLFDGGLHGFGQMASLMNRDVYPAPYQICGNSRRCANSTKKNRALYDACMIVAALVEPVA